MFDATPAEALYSGRLPAGWGGRWYGCYPATVAIETIYHPQGRPSHYQPWRDTLRIVATVAWELLGRGLYPTGLLRSLRLLPLPVSDHEALVKQQDTGGKA